MEEAPVVTVEQGQLQGRIATSPTGKSFYSFQGIPYAKPPLGSLRFQVPQPPEPWDGIRDATSEGNVSAQLNTFAGNQYTGDENCLFLNVYTTNLDGAFLPVMIFIHGGGFKFGSGNTDFYGPDYLVEKDVIIVTINYRCGALGFLSLNTPEVPGNAGLKDIVEAIRWVKENIHNFGGNSGNITIFGESAGGMAVGYLAASPVSKNLFNKAIIQSGNALSSYSVQKTPIENAKRLAKELGCEADDTEEILDYLRACSAKEIVEGHQNIISRESFLDNPFTVVVEKEFPGVEAFLTEPYINILTSGRVAQIPVMIGACALEFSNGKKTDDLQTLIPAEFNIEHGSAESLQIAEELKQLYFKGDESDGVFKLTSDRYVKVDAYRFVQYLIQVTNKPIYYYDFNYVGDLNLYRRIIDKNGSSPIGHMDELGYLFRNDYQTDLVLSDEDNKMREIMLRLWTNFAKTGNPTPEESHYLPVTWQPVTKDDLYYLNISSELGLAINPDKERMEYWDNLYRKHFRIWEHPKSEEATEKYDPPIVIASYTEADVVPTADLTSNVIITERTEITSESNGIITITSKISEELINIGDDVHVTENNEAVIDSEINEAPIASEINEAPITSEIKEAPNALVDTEVLIASEENGAVIISDGNNIDIVDEAKTEQEDKIESPKVKEPVGRISPVFNNHLNGDRKVRTSNEIKMVSNKNGAPKDVIRANDPPEDDLPKNIGVNKFVNFFESLGGKK